MKKEWGAVLSYFAIGYDDFDKETKQGNFVQYGNINPPNSPHRCAVCGQGFEVGKYLQRHTNHFQGACNGTG